MPRTPAEWKDRALALAHLDAAKHYLETCSDEEFAIELLVQGFDAVGPDRRGDVLIRALDKYRDESAELDES